MDDGKSVDEICRMAYNFGIEGVGFSENKIFIAFFDIFNTCFYRM